MSGLPKLFHFIDKTCYFLYLDDGLSHSSTGEPDHDDHPVGLTVRVRVACLAPDFVELKFDPFARH
jgi:hypothetical protein